jgi:hypothetical protein
VETFRCPTCIAVLSEPRAPRCPSCGQNIRRRRPVVLGDDHRKGAYLPVDRWMLARLHAEGSRARQHIAPVAWHGKFETSPLAEPAFAAMPSPVATPLAPPTITAPEPPAPRLETDVPPIETEAPEAPGATVGALTLDAYTRAASHITDESADDATAAAAVAMPEAMGTPEVDDGPHIAATAEPAPPMAYTPEPLPAVPTLPAMPRPVPHEELDPEVRALVDDLYEQARQELSGNNDMAFFAPVDDRNEHGSLAPPSVAPLRPHDDLVDVVEYMPPALQAGTEQEPVIVDTMDPLPPVAAEKLAPQPNASDTAQPRRGWQPAFVADDTRKRNLIE